MKQAFMLLLSGIVVTGCNDPGQGGSTGDTTGSGSGGIQGSGKSSPQNTENSTGKGAPGSQGSLGPQGGFNSPGGYKDGAATNTNSGLDGTPPGARPQPSKPSPNP